MDDKEEELLNDPTGGPSAPSQSGSDDQRDDAIDPSAGAESKEDKGAVEETREQEGDDKVNPG